MGMGENVGCNVGENTGSSGSTYTGVTPIITSIIGNDDDDYITVYFNTGVQLDSGVGGASYEDGIAISVNSVSATPNYIQASSSPGNGIIVYRLTRTPAKPLESGDLIELIYTSSTGNIVSVLGNVALEDQTVTHTVLGNNLIFSDNFESYVLGAARTSGALSNGWDYVEAKNSIVGDTYCVIANDVATHSGTKCFRVDINGSGESMLGLSYLLPTELKEDFYVQWWEYHKPNFVSGLEKTNRYRTSGNFGTTGLDYPGGEDSVIFANSTGANNANAENGLSEPAARWNGNLGFPFGTWTRIEVHFNLGTPNTADGQVQVWVNGVANGTSPLLQMRTTSVVLDYVQFGGWVGAGGGTNMVRYIDDVKIHSSYIGDSYD